MLIKLWNYLRGYVIIEVCGFSVERFMNLAANRGIYLWNITRNGNRLRMSVSIKGFKLLKYCAKKTRCRVKVIKKYGFPFTLFKYRKRKIFLGGIVVVLVLLYFLSSFIWTIEINGNKSLTKSKVIEAINNEGCKIGTLKNKINCDTIEENILKKYPEVSWISIEVKGTGLMVNLVESVAKPEIVDKSKQSPCNIVADKDCIIQSIVTKSGTPMVKAGDVVKKGDILVSGEVDITFDDGTIQKKFVSSDADIVGKTYYEIDDELRYEYYKKNYTNKKKHELYLVLGNKKIRLFHHRKIFDNYDSFIEKKEFKFINYKLPFEFIVVTNNEYTKQKMKYSKKELKTNLNNRINKVINKNFDKESIIDQKTEFIEEKNLIKSKTFLYIIEQVGKLHNVDVQIEMIENNE